MSQPPRPIPKLDQENTAFWTGGSEGKLRIVHCLDCGQYTHPPRLLCRHCQSENIEHEAVAGTGIVDTYTINHQPWAKDLDVPYVIARIALDGVPGVLITSNIVNCAVGDVDFGDKVRVVFEQQGDIHYPLFEKTGGDS